MSGFADPLSTLDTLFLAAERDHAPMHIGTTLVFEKGPFAPETIVYPFNLVRERGVVSNTRA